MRNENRSFGTACHNKSNDFGGAARAAGGRGTHARALALIRPAPGNTFWYSGALPASRDARARTCAYPTGPGEYVPVLRRTTGVEGRTRARSHLSGRPQEVRFGTTAYYGGKAPGGSAASKTQSLENRCPLNLMAVWESYHMLAGTH